MYDLSAVITKALRNNAKIVGWCAKDGTNPNISANKLPKAIFPCIQVTETMNIDTTFGNDTDIASEVRYQVSLFTQDSSHVLIQTEVDKVMKSLGFLRYNAYTMQEDLTKTVNRYLSYRMTITEQEYGLLTNK